MGISLYMKASSPSPVLGFVSQMFLARFFCIFENTIACAMVIVSFFFFSGCFGFLYCFYRFSVLFRIFPFYFPCNCVFYFYNRCSFLVFSVHRRMAEMLKIIWFGMAGIPHSSLDLSFHLSLFG